MSEQHQEHDYHADHPNWPEGYEPGTEQDLDTGSIIHITIVGTLVTILVILLLKHLFFGARDEEFKLKAYGTVNQAMVSLREAQLKQISDYAWTDARAGVVSMPIDKAIELTLQQYADGGSDTGAAPAADAASVQAPGTETAGEQIARLGTTDPATAEKIRQHPDLTEKEH